MHFFCNALQRNNIGIMCWFKNVIYILIFFDISRTVVGVFTGKFMWMRLNRIRVKYLYHFTEVDTLHQIINILVVVIVGKYDECLRYITGLGKTYNKMAKIFYAIMDLKIIFGVNGIALSVWFYNIQDVLKGNKNINQLIEYYYITFQ